MIKKILARMYMFLLARSMGNDAFLKKAYSQEGEDLILCRIFENQKNGFYVDVGAHHPKRFSNTYLFYKREWSGINIDAMPGCMKLFDKIRPRDKNIEIPIANSVSEKVFYVFEEPALNTFDSELAKTYIDAGFKLETKKTLKAHKLEDVLKQWVPVNQEISFMSIDVEGLELEVLESNNWNFCRPHILLIEVLNCNCYDDVLKTSIHKFVITKGYILIAKTVSTVIYKDEKKCVELPESGI